VTRLGLALALALLAGCLSSRPFVKAGGTQEEFSAVQYECEQRVGSTVSAALYHMDPLANMHYPWQAKREMHACLNHHGWTEQQEIP